MGHLALIPGPWRSHEGQSPFSNRDPDRTITAKRRCGECGGPEWGSLSASVSVRSREHVVDTHPIQQLLASIEEALEGDQ